MSYYLIRLVGEDALVRPYQGSISQCRYVEGVITNGVVREDHNAILCGKGLITTGYLRNGVYHIHQGQCLNYEEFHRLLALSTDKGYAISYRYLNAMTKAPHTLLFDWERDYVTLKKELGSLVKASNPRRKTGKDVLLKFEGTSRRRSPKNASLNPF